MINYWQRSDFRYQ